MSLYRKYSNKRVNAKKENIPFYLTFDEFKMLANNKNIGFKDMNIKGFHLARYQDSGPYSIDNCRFLYYKENYKERKLSEKSKLSAKNSLIFFNKNVSKKEREKTRRKAADTWKITYKNASVENKRTMVHGLSENEINQRHQIIKSIPTVRGRLLIASKIIMITPQALGRFLKKYPLK